MSGAVIPFKLQIAVGVVIMHGPVSPQRRLNSRDWEHSDWTQWSETQVASWIKGHLGLPYADVIIQNRIDGPTLLELTDQDLHDYLDIVNPLHRKKLLGHTKLLRRSTLDEENGVAITNGAHSSEELFLLTPPADQAAGNSFGYSSDVGMAMSLPEGHQDDELPVPKLHPAVAANHVRRSQSQPPVSSDMPLSARGGLSRVAEDKDLMNLMHLSENGGNAPWNALAERSPLSMSPYGSHKKQGRMPAGPIRMPEERCPGPNSYLVERGSVPMPRSPRAVIGTHRRDISEHFVNPLHCSPGAGKHLGYLPPRRVPGGSFGNAPRWNYDRKNLLASLGY